MARLVLKLIMLLSLVLMPFGMSTAVARTDAHHAGSPAAKSHCAGGQDQDAPAVAMDSDCLVCAGLPVALAGTAAERLTPRTPLRLELAHRFTGIEPEIATPPPKLA